MKPSQVEMKLQQLKMPCIGTRSACLEQYHTPPHIVANLLWDISQNFGCIRDEVVLDLGCGSGIFGIGCLLLGSKFVVGVDVDSNSIETAKANAEGLGFTDKHILFMNQDIKDLDLNNCLENKAKFDTVVMNPPFGTRGQVGTDLLFVLKGLENANTVYSIHKTSTRDFWIRKGIELGVHVKPLTELRFNIEHSFKFHKYDRVDIVVDFLQFKHII